jgi:hypothetical protein
VPARGRQRAAAARGAALRLPWHLLAGMVLGLGANVTLHKQPVDYTLATEGARQKAETAVPASQIKWAYTTLPGPWDWCPGGGGGGCRAGGRPAATLRAGLEDEEKVLTKVGDGPLILNGGQTSRPCAERVPRFDVPHGRRLHRPSDHPRRRRHRHPGQGHRHSARLNAARPPPALVRA